MDGAHTKRGRLDGGESKEWAKVTADNVLVVRSDFNGSNSFKIHEEIQDVRSKLAQANGDNFTVYVHIEFTALHGAKYTIEASGRGGDVEYNVQGYNPEQKRGVDVIEIDETGGKMTVCGFFWGVFKGDDTAKEHFKASSGDKQNWPGYGPRGMLIVKYLGLVRNVSEINLSDSWRRMVKFDDGTTSGVGSSEYAKLVEDVVSIRREHDDWLDWVVNTAVTPPANVSEQVGRLRASDAFMKSTSFRQKLLYEASRWPHPKDGKPLFTSWYNYFGMVPDRYSQKTLMSHRGDDYFVNTAAVLHV